MRAVLLSAPSPLWGGIKGGGESLAPRLVPLPTLALPIKGREPSGMRGKIVERART